MSDTAYLPDEVRDLPNSAKLVYVHLRSNGPATRSEISNGLAMPESTLHYALESLLNTEQIKRRVELNDARQTVYSLR